jgi:hypothetical protein
MDNWLIGDRVAVPNRSGSSADLDEKVKIVGYGHTHLHYQAKFADGEIKEVYSGNILVDTDHQTSLDVAEVGGDHLLMLTYKPNPALDPVAQTVGDGLERMSKMRLDVLALVMQGVSLYSSTGNAIDALRRNAPPSDVDDGSNHYTATLIFTQGKMVIEGTIIHVLATIADNEKREGWLSTKKSPKLIKAEADAAEKRRQRDLAAAL